jgi:autotransporter-associated beta strand protein
VGANWSGTPPAGGPAAAGDVDTINSALTANSIINLFQTGDSGTAGKSVGVLSIGAASGTNTFTVAAGSGGGSLILNNNGAGAQINELSTAAGDTISAPVQISDLGGLTVSNSSGNLFTISGAITSSGTGVNLVLDDEGAGGIKLSSGTALGNRGAVTNSGTGTGVTTISSVIGPNVTGVIENSASSVLSLGGINTFAGGLTVTLGTVSSSQGAPTALGTGRISLGNTANGSTGNATLLYTGTNLAIANPITVNAGSSGTLALEGQTNTNRFTGNITLNNALTLANLTAGKTITVSGTLTGSSTVTIGSANLGTVAISGSNGSSFTGNIVISGGILNFASGSLGNGPGLLTMNGGTLQYATGNTQDISSRLAASGATAVKIDVNGNSVIFGTPIGSAFTGGLTLTSSIAGGSLVLGGPQTYTGVTTIGAAAANSGTLLLSSSGASIKSGNALTTLAGGTFNMNGNSQTLGLVTNGGLITNSGSGTPTLTIGNGSTGAGTFTGAMNLIWNQGATSSTITGSFANAGNFTLDANGAGGIGITTANNAGFITNSGTGAGAATISGVVGPNVTGVIEDSASSLLALNGPDTFTGGLTVTLGTVSSNQAGPTGFGAGPISLGNTATGNTSNATLLYTGTNFAVNNPITVDAGSSGSLTIEGQTNTNAFTGNITLNNALTLANLTAAKMTTFSGAISGTSVITVGGGNLGTVDLAGNSASTYSGPITLGSGILMVGNTAGSATGIGTVTLNGGTLASLPGGTAFGAGTAGFITGTVMSGTGTDTIAPGGIGADGHLTINNLITNSNTTLNFDLTAPETASDDELIVTGTATIGTGTKIALNGTAPSANGYYRLLDYGSSPGPGTSNFLISTAAPANHAYSVASGSSGGAGDGGWVDLAVVNSETWNSAITSGSWSSLANWTGGVVPNNIGDIALAGATTTTGTTTLDESITLGILEHNQNVAWIILSNGTNVITMQNVPGQPAVIEELKNNLIDIQPNIAIGGAYGLELLAQGSGNSSEVKDDGGIGGTGPVTLSTGSNSSVAPFIDVTGPLNFAGALTASGVYTFGNNLPESVITVENIASSVTSITKNGGNILDLSGTTGAYGNSVTVTGGILQLTSTNAVNLSTATFAIGNGAILGVTQNQLGGASGFPSAAIDSLLANPNVTFSDGLIGIDTTADASGFAYSTAITDLNGQKGVAKLGTNALTLGAANGYSGPTEILNGTLIVSSFNSVNGGVPSFASSSLGAPTTIANGTIVLGYGDNAATLEYIGKGETTDRVIDINNYQNSDTINASGSGLIKFTSNLTGAAGGAAKTLTLTGTGAGQFAGNITNVSGVISVTKTGTGAWTLSGSDTYTGATTISAGSLIVSGSLSATSTVTVSAGASLGGGGLVGGLVSVSGTIAPGFGLSSAGTMLTTSSNVTFNTGSQLVVNLDDPRRQVDLLAVSGSLTLNGQDTLTLDLLDGGRLTSGNSYVIATFGANELTGSFSTIKNLPANYRVNYNEAAGEILLVAIPEPGTWAMILAGFGCLFIFRFNIGRRR